MFLGWSQIFNSKIAIKTRTICRGVWNLPHKFHLYLIYICQLKINRICFRHFESRHFQVLTIKCQVLGFFNLFPDFFDQNQNLAFSGLWIFRISPPLLVKKWISPDWLVLENKINLHIVAFSIFFASKYKHGETFCVLMIYWVIRLYYIILYFILISLHNWNSINHVSIVRFMSIWSINFYVNVKCLVLIPRKLNNSSMAAE